MLEADDFFQDMRVAPGIGNSDRFLVGIYPNDATVDADPIGSQCNPGTGSASDIQYAVTGIERKLTDQFCAQATFYGVMIVEPCRPCERRACRVAILRLRHDHNSSYELRQSNKVRAL
jgi:hypothetical protein